MLLSGRGTDHAAVGAELPTMLTPAGRRLAGPADLNLSAIDAARLDPESEPPGWCVAGFATALRRDHLPARAGSEAPPTPPATGGS